MPNPLSGHLNSTLVFDSEAGKYGIAPAVIESVEDAVDDAAAASAAANAAVPKALYDANSILVATANDDPQPLTIAASRVLGRKASGDIAALTGAEVIELLGTYAAGRTIQVVRTFSSAVASGGGNIDQDNTIPQISEGNAYSALDTTITPTSALSTLLLDLVLNVSSNGNSQIVCAAIFRDLTANAVAAASTFLSLSDKFAQIVIRAAVPATSTAATTFKVRYGDIVIGGATIYINSLLAGGGVFGGVCFSSLTVTEVAP